MRFALLLAATLVLSACSLVEDSATSGVTVNAVTLEALPDAPPHGSPWDDTSPPDIYVELQDALGRVYLTGGLDDADALPLPMEAESTRFLELERQYFVYAVERDEDTSSNEWTWVGATTGFSFAELAEEKPETLRLRDTNGELCILLSLAWD